MSIGFNLRGLRGLINGMAGGVLMLALTGCVTADKPTLSVEARQSLKLTGVDVAFAPNAVIHVSQVEDEVNTRGDASREQIKQAEMDHIRHVLPEEFMAAVGPSLAGVRPVTAHVTIGYFYIPGPVATLVSGGSFNINGGVDLVDAKTGETLVSVPPGKIFGSVVRPGGVLGLAVQAASAYDASDVKTRQMARSFATEYAQWVASN
jgi:hypothetical protein